MRAIRLGLLLLLGCSGAARAEEGLWTFDQPPLAAIHERYGFALEPSFLDRLRLASVRFNSGGSGAFVSKRGLVLTNHHVGADCIQKLGKRERDYVREGFLAPERKRELRCPDLELNVLEEITDVSQVVRAVEQSGVDAAAQLRLQKAKMAEIEKRCIEEQPKAKRALTRCEIVVLYHGAAYHRYRYRRYTDVRLAFAPEFQIAFFGGHPDNFEYPRFDLDVALFRVYEGGQPLTTRNYLPWSPTGAVRDELVFVSGHPGMTERLLTVAQLETMRDVVYPKSLEHLDRVRKVIAGYAARGAEEERQAQQLQFQYENSWKAVTGYFAGLRDPALLDKKRIEEKQLREVMEVRREGAGPLPFDAIATAQQRYRALFQRYWLFEGKHADPTGSELFWIGRAITRFAEEHGKPNGERLREFRDSNLPSLELGLFSGAPIHVALDEVLLASALQHLVDTLGMKDPTVVAILDGKTAAERAHLAVATTRLGDVTFRKQLWRDARAAKASDDPMLRLVRAYDGEARRIRRQYEDEVEAPIKQGTTAIGRARFGLRQAGAYPDATWSLRLSYGRVAGYREAGRDVPWTTTFGGLFERAQQKGETPPWDLPTRWKARRGALDPATPYNFVSTADIIGGSSGSPVVNRKGELVGVIFDGNLAMLPNNFLYRDDTARSISVQSVAIVEAMRKVYDAGRLADELLGR